MDQDFAAIAAEHYGIRCSAHPLPGEIDRNASLESENGERYLLRLSPPDTDPAVLEFQREVLRCLGTVDRVDVPRIVAASGGENVVMLPTGWSARMFTWVPGTTFAAAGRPPEAAASIGKTAGAIVRALAKLDHPAADRKLEWDLRNTASAIEINVWAIPDPRRRRLVNEIARRTDQLPLDRVPIQVIHNDLNDENLLIEDGRVVGVIDVGDSVRSIRIGEAAIAATYAMLDQDDPVTVGAAVLRGFAEVVPVSEEEVRALLDLILARLATSVAVSARRGGSNPHHVASEPMAWDLLERLAVADWSAIDAEFARAAGLDRYTGSRRAELLAVRKSRLGPSLSLAYEEPLHIVRGFGAHLFDGRGRRYLDAVNNVAHVGHSHPRVVAAAADQMAILNTNTRYLHEELVRYADRLATLLPDPLEVVYLVNSGSEANELAIRLARTATGARDVACFDHGYHGNTTTLIGVSPYKFNGPGGSGKPDWVAVLPGPDPFRNRDFAGEGAAERYVSAVDEVLMAHQGRIACFITEALPGCAGQVVPNPGVISAAYRVARERGAVVIADEVQTGFGRVGSAFWAFELHDVIPDIVTMGKPIGNGHPMGAVVTTRPIAETFEMEYFNTFGGNPVSSAIGNAVLDVIDGESLQQNALDVGTKLMTALSGIAEKEELIGDVRGSGLFIGIELVTDRDPLRPAPQLAKQIVEHAQRRGVLLSVDGPDANVIKIKPPLVFSSADAERLEAVLAEALASQPDE